MRTVFLVGHSGARPIRPAGAVQSGQSASILRSSARAGAPRLWARQLQLAIADLPGAVHDTHHPIWGNVYCEDQKKGVFRHAPELDS